MINSTFNHGTSCAGIIAAVHNNIGVRGVAGGVKILPVNITKGTRDNFGNTIFSEHDSIANAIRWAVDHGADILSCSWGGNFESNSITDAIIYARTFGRLGKGSVVVAASGNYFESLPYVVMFPARANWQWHIYPEPDKENGGRTPSRNKLGGRRLRSPSSVQQTLDIGSDQCPYR